MVTAPTSAAPLFPARPRRGHGSVPELLRSFADTMPVRLPRRVVPGTLPWLAPGALALVALLAALTAGLRADRSTPQGGQSAARLGRWVGEVAAVPPSGDSSAQAGAPNAAPALRLAEPTWPRTLEIAQGRLTKALAATPDDPALHSDLALVLLRSADPRDRGNAMLAAAEELEIAAELVRRGDASDALQRTVLYNRALLLTDLGLREQARAAWQALQGLGAADLAGEIASAQRALAQPTTFESWQAGGRELLLAAARRGDASASTRLTRRYTTLAFTWLAEELLPAWAAAQQANSGGGEVLPTLTTLAGAVASTLGDHSVADTLAAFQVGSRREQDDLLSGLVAFGQAMQAYRSYGDDGKDAVLAQAANRLAAAKAPLAGWARFYAAVGLHRSRPDEADRALAGLAAATDAGRYPALAARLEQMLGTNGSIQNDREQALAHYRRSRQLYLATGEEAYAAFAQLLIGEAEFQLGNPRAAWNARLAALRTVSAWGEPSRLHGLLFSTLEQLLREERFAAARPWLAELQANAERWGAPIAVAETALQAGRLAAAEGLQADAAAHFERSYRAASSTGSQALRTRTLGTLELYQAESQGPGDAAVAQAGLESARQSMLAVGYRYQLSRLDVERGRTALLQGDRAGAEAALAEALAEEEEVRRRIGNPERRAAAFEQVQTLFDGLLTLSLDRRGGDDDAFRYAERSRSRLVLDQLSPHDDGPATEPVDLERLQAEIPPGVTLVELAVLPERLVGWSIEHDHEERFETAIQAQELARKVTELNRRVGLDATAEDLKPLAAELWRLLLEPVAGRLAPGQPLVLVPDRYLGRLPFTLLFDPTRQRFLVEDHPLAVAPSASAYLALRRRRRSEPAPSSVLAVGANNPTARTLDRVAPEAADVRALYPAGRELRGEDATQAAFTAAAAGAEVLHFAGHNVEDALAPLRSRLLFAPAWEGDSGALTAREIASLSLPHTRLAVLATCRALSGDAPGREVLSGTATAFLAAGVPAVVANLWDSEDTTTHELMLAFHANFRRGLSASEALRRAQLDQLRSPTPLAARHWAGWEVVGAE